MFALVKNGRVGRVEAWTELPPFTPEHAAEYVEVLEGMKAPEIGDEWTGSDFVTPQVPLEDLRASKIAAIKREGLTRITAQVPALDSLPMVKLMAELWPGLDTASLGAGLTTAKDIYLHAKTKISEAQSATRAQLESYDPTTDPNWPA